MSSSPPYAPTHPNCSPASPSYSPSSYDPNDTTYVAAPCALHQHEPKLHIDEFIGDDEKASSVAILSDTQRIRFVYKSAHAGPTWNSYKYCVFKAPIGDVIKEGDKAIEILFDRAETPHVVHIDMKGDKCYIIFTR